MEELEQQINLTTFLLSFVFQPVIAIGYRPIHHISYWNCHFGFLFLICVLFWLCERLPARCSSS